MTAITIRKLPEGVKQKLRMQAAENGRSMEAEARSILVAALEQDGSAEDWIDRLSAAARRYGGDDGVDLVVPRPGMTRVPDFSDFPISGDE